MKSGSVFLFIQRLLAFTTFITAGCLRSTFSIQWDIVNPTWYGLLNYLVVWGGGWKCPQGRMATEANWGQCRGYQSWQILFLTSFPICRAFEKSPMLYSFAVRGRRSHLLSPRKIISFSVYENPNFVNFWVIWTICTSNESWEHSEFKFDMKKCNLLQKIGQKSFFLRFCLIFGGIFFFETQIFRKFL